MGALNDDRFDFNDVIVMNWVDYPGQMMAAQGYVSLQKSIGSLAENKAALTRVLWDTAATPQGQGREATTVRRCSLRIWLDFPSLCADQTAPAFSRFQICPRQRTFTRRAGDTFVAPALMCFTLAEASEELGNRVRSPQHETFMSILDASEKD